MLTIGTMPILLKIVGKLDITPVIERLKGVDIFEDSDSAEGALKQLSKEKVGILGAEILTDIAAYKGVSLEEANKLDAAEVINEFINDDGIVNFFKNALRKKAGQEH